MEQVLFFLVYMHGWMEKGIVDEVAGSLYDSDDSNIHVMGIRWNGKFNAIAYIASPPSPDPTTPLAAYLPTYLYQSKMETKPPRYRHIKFKIQQDPDNISNRSSSQPVCPGFLSAYGW